VPSRRGFPPRAQAVTPFVCKDSICLQLDELRDGALMAARQASLPLTVVTSPAPPRGPASTPPAA